MKKTLIIFIGAMIILIGSYLVAREQLSWIPQSNEKLTVATLDYAPFALMYIAQHKGYFKEEGLDITYKTFPRGIDSLEDALKGNSDIGLANETPAVRKIYEGEKLRIVSTLHSATKNTAIIARKDRNILNVNDLKGKKIGVTKKASYEFFLYSFLLSQGIQLSEVTYVDGDLNSMATLLKNGEVDAVATGNIYKYDVEKVFPEAALSIFQSEVYTENSIIGGREDIIKHKKEAITRFLRALARAEDFYRTNNQESLNAVVAELPSVSEEAIRSTWKNFTPQLKLGNVLLTLLNREGQWFKDNGVYTTEVPNFREAIFTDYLKSVRPDTVTLY